MTMSSKHEGRDRAILLALLALALFATPTISWWLTAAPPWYLPYLLWLGIILLAIWQNCHPSRRKSTSGR